MLGRLMICGALLAASVSAQAAGAGWPTHGLYQVTRDGDGKRPLCTLQGEIGDDWSDPRLFRLFKYEDGSLLAFFASASWKIKPTRQVTFGLDGRPVLEFTTLQSFSESDTPIVAMFGWVAEGNQGEPTLRRLESAASGAQWLNIQVLPYEGKLPAAGLSDALADLRACQSGKGRPGPAPQGPAAAGVPSSPARRLPLAIHGLP